MTNPICGISEKYVTTFPRFSGLTMIGGDSMIKFLRWALPQINRVKDVGTSSVSAETCRHGRTGGCTGCPYDCNGQDWWGCTLDKHH